MSEIRLHAQRNENTTKRINLTADNFENFNARKFKFDKFAIKYIKLYVLNVYVDSTTLTKPNAYVTVNYRY